MIPASPDRADRRRSADRLPAPARRWLVRWGHLLPVLIAELFVLVGFGALLPILPLYLVSNGIDTALLGLIIAAWPIAKLVSEPIFGYLGDRRARRPLMLLALVLLAVSMLMPVWLTSAPAFFAARFLGGAATGMYDPAARGIIVDATTTDRRGEAFGLYGAFQMGGLILGPVIGAAGAAIVGGFAFPFIFTAGLVLLSAVYLFFSLRGTAATIPTTHRAVPPPTTAAPWPVQLTPGGEELAGGLVAEAAVAATRPPEEQPASVLRPDSPGHDHQPPGRLANRLLLAALVMQLTSSFATGVYEVIWSLFMERLGASVAWIGLTFTLFGLPIMLVSPLAGRLVDRHGGLRFAVAGGLLVTGSGLLYPLASEPVLPAVIGVVEACGVACVGPGLFWLLARGTPPGRTSTAQGLFGAAGTVGFIISSLAAGVLWELDYRLPFSFFVVVSLAGLAAGVAIAGRRRPGRVPDARGRGGGLLPRVPPG